MEKLLAKIRQNLRQLQKKARKLSHKLTLKLSRCLFQPTLSQTWRIGISGRDLWLKLLKNSRNLLKKKRKTLKRTVKLLKAKKTRQLRSHLLEQKAGKRTLKSPKTTC